PCASPLACQMSTRSPATRAPAPADRQSGSRLRRRSDTRDQGGSRSLSRNERAVATGTVKFFNAEKGYGFIARDGEKDVFVHYSNIVGSGYRTLEADQRVEFEVQPGRKGDEAVNVRLV